MPSIEGRLTDRRLVLDLIIAPPDPFGTKGADLTDAVEATGLVDTGATRTAVSSRLAEQLGLVPHGKTMVLSARGKNAHSLFSFRLGFRPPPSADRPTFPWMLEGSILGIDWTDQARFEVLIGMDVISQCDLLIRRSGSFSLTLP